MSKPTSTRSLSNPGKAARHVLVLRGGDLRGFVLAMSAMQAIRSAHPRAELVLAVSSEVAPFARLCPFADTVVDDLASDSKQIRAARIAALRKTEFDMIYDLDGTKASAQLRAAMQPRFGQPLPWSGPDADCAFPGGIAKAGQDEADRLASQLMTAGTIAKGTRLPPPSFAWMRAKLGNPPRLSPEYFAITPPYALIALDDGRAGVERCWPEGEVKALARRLVEANITPVLCGDKATGKLAQKVEMDVRAAKNIVARADIPQLISLVEQAAIVIGTDTATLQIAGILARPCILLAASRVDDPARNAPLTPMSITIHDPTLETISAETVWRAIARWNMAPGGGRGAQTA